MSRSPSISGPQPGIHRLPPAAPSVPALIDLYTASPGESEDGNPETRDALAKKIMVLELADGTIYQGYGFGVSGKSVSGECVFQTGACSLLAVSVMITLLLNEQMKPLPFCFRNGRLS